MNKPEKLRLSNSYFIEKAVCFLLLFYCLVCLTEYKSIKVEEILQYTISILALILVLYYLFTRKDLYYNEKNLYVIESKKRKYIIPLKNIKQVRFNNYTIRKIDCVYRIKYEENDGRLKELKIVSGYLNKVSLFLNYIEKVNPYITIINRGFK